MRRPVAVRATVALLVASLVATPGAAQAPTVSTLDIRAFRPVEGPSSGPAVYYQVIEDPEGTLLRGHYRPGMESVSMGIEIPDAARQSVRRVRWRWRARVFPTGGDECRPGKGDSAASVSFAFKRGLKWYVLKYVWSSLSRLGAVCDSKRSMFMARDTIVLESGGAPGTWLVEVVDVRRAFIEHFARGDRHADVPDLVGIGVMTDGDQTSSEAAADWADFEVLQ